MKPELSVIVTIYNTAPYLEKCLASIASQNLPAMEVLCVDNCSTDGSTEIAQSFAQKDARFQYHKTQSHIRASENRNVGLALAQGRFLTYVDADDSLQPGLYADMLARQAQWDADIVVCNYNMVYKDKTLPAYSAMQDEVLDFASLSYSDYFYRYFCMPKPNNYVWSRLFRTQLLRENGLGFHEVDISEDTIFTMFSTFYAKKVAHMAKAYYNYYQREESAVRATIRKKDIAQSFVYAFGTVEDFVRRRGLEKAFADIFPLYAFTRMRSILFYMQLVGHSEQEAYRHLRAAIRGTAIPGYLHAALYGGYLARYANLQHLSATEQSAAEHLLHQCLEEG